eukprot:363275-Chlamydomonas_euryale.AAC.17
MSAIGPPECRHSPCCSSVRTHAHAAAGLSVYTHCVGQSSWEGPGDYRMRARTALGGAAAAAHVMKGVYTCTALDGAAAAAHVMKGVYTCTALGGAAAAAHVMKGVYTCTALGGAVGKVHGI